MRYLVYVIRAEEVKGSRSSLGLRKVFALVAELKQLSVNQAVRRVHLSMFLLQYARRFASADLQCLVLQCSHWFFLIVAVF